MLAFAKDISHPAPVHPEESKDGKLKEYMEYQRSLRHERLVYHALDRAKTGLQENIADHPLDASKVEEYVRNMFPVSAPHVKDADNLMTMLRKLINAHNATSHWYQFNAFYAAVLYDCLERFSMSYNKLVREEPDKAEDLSLFAGPAREVDFDDWAQLYFHNLDFLAGKAPRYVHFVFYKRNDAIEKAAKEEMAGGKSREEAFNSIKGKFSIEPSTIKVILGKTTEYKDLELLFTSTENPIYEYLYETDAAEGFMDGESLIDHSYFLSFQLKGLSKEEAEAALQETAQLQKK
ncbi:MAG: hypothetical protein COV67_07620 [Nitrospinae bacterium CG11_big_fil_rev_8_21_14_0_20_56_8]|nr:MAG: hypothetical protein COV67_07620 [Nitrospinae bacterium CG11_big_fil_rev_8_21_14_0_20_56_8]